MNPLMVIRYLSRLDQILKYFTGSGAVFFFKTAFSFKHYLRMTDLPYEVVATMPLKGPKGKLPFIEDDGQKLTDSRFIIEYLKEKYGDSLDKELSAEQQATMIAMQRLLEEHLY